MKKGSVLWGIIFATPYWLGTGSSLRTRYWLGTGSSFRFSPCFVNRTDSQLPLNLFTKRKVKKLGMKFTLPSDTYNSSQLTTRNILHKTV